MDEPLSNLDSGLRSELRAEISSLVRDLGVTTLYVTHDQTEALTMADRVAILRRGVLQDVGSPADVYGRPATLYVAERIVLGLRPEALRPVPIDAADGVLRGSIRYVEHHGHESLAFLDVGATAVHVDDLGAVEPASPSRSPRRVIGAAVRQLAGRSGSHNRGRLPMAPPNSTDTLTANVGPQSVFVDPSHRHRRPAEFAVRLAPYPSGSPGQAMAVAVALDQAHFFDEYGKRIDVGRR
jgi:multiple sugar transport system ATP-binding protein